MSTFTLFIDESGDFASPKGEWIVAGHLFAGTYVLAEQEAANAMGSLLAEFSLKGKHEVHLTRVRSERGIDDANKLAGTILTRVRRAPSFIAGFAVIANAVSTHVGRERVYRMMLLDLLALADSGRRVFTEVNSLDLVIATRTIDGMSVTTAADVQADVLNRLPELMEAGLASRGITEAMGRGKIHVYMQRASGSWGLATSDALCNLLFNRTYVEARSALDRLQSDGSLRVFTGLGGTLERRARVLERDGDVPAAITQWASLCASRTKTASTPPAEIARLWVALLAEGRTAGPMAAVESVIEGIWRRLHDDRSPRPACEAYGAAIEGLLIAATEQPMPIMDAMLFRLRNMQLLTANRCGDAALALRITTEQDAAVQSISRNPDWLSLVFQYSLIAIDVPLLQLDTAGLQARAEAYSRLVGEYRALWDLFAEPRQGDEQYESSRLWLRARSASLRAGVARVRLAGVPVDQSWIEEMEVLELCAPTNSDRLRLRNLRATCLAGAGFILEALEVIRSTDLSVTDSYSAATAAFVHARAAFTGDPVPQSDRDRLRPVLEQCLLKDYIGHQYCALLRDAALGAFLMDCDTKSAMALLARARRALVPSTPPQPLLALQSLLLDATESIITKAAVLTDPLPVNVLAKFHELVPGSTSASMTFADLHLRTPV